MTVIFVSFLAFELWAEHHPNPMVTRGTVAAKAQVSPGDNMEGKEVRFGVTNSALWATATTATSNGSVNSMHDSFMPLAGLAPLLLLHIGEVIYGGVGSGLYGMFVFVIIAVFVGGLMVGRTPEYLGKKVEGFEMKMASVVALVPIFFILVATAIAVAVPAGIAGVANPGPHGYSEILYAFSSQGANNGSAFAGISANTPFYNTAGRHSNVLLPVPGRNPHTGDRGEPGREEDGAGKRGHAADAYAAFYRLACFSDTSGGGAQLLPGACARADSRTSDDVNRTFSFG